MRCTVEAGRPTHDNDDRDRWDWDKDHHGHGKPSPPGPTGATGPTCLLDTFIVQGDTVTVPGGA